MDLLESKCQINIFKKFHKKSESVYYLKQKNNMHGGGLLYYLKLRGI